MKCSHLVDLLTSHFDASMIGSCKFTNAFSQMHPLTSVLYLGIFFEPISNVIDVNFDYNVVKAVMSFIYSGRLDEAMVVNWPDLFVMARYYQLDVLAVHSELRMMVNMPKDMESIKKMIKFAISYQARDLKQYIIKMARNIQETRECKMYWNVCVCPKCLN